MKIVSVKYEEFLGQDQEWTIDPIGLKACNLVVGRNSTGKSRLLSIVNNFARYFLGHRPMPLNGNYRVAFEHDGSEYVFEAKMNETELLEERLTINGDPKIVRGKDGEGEIFANELGGGSFLKFRSPPTDWATVSRRDSLQHPYLEPLFTWAQGVRFFPFGTSFGKDTVFIHNPSAPPPDELDFNLSLPIFRKAYKEYGDQFIDIIKQDMATLDYEIDEIGVAPPITIQFSVPTPATALYVKQKGIRAHIDQWAMSTGMFRVTALLIHIAYSQLKGQPSCFIIDDVGEGLDFERSCQLISLLRDKCAQANIQLLLSTNDRFVMNAVPLEEWCLLQRTGHHVHALTEENSRDLFDEFKFTGLSNFSFFEENTSPNSEQKRHDA